VNSALKRLLPAASNGFGLMGETANQEIGRFESMMSLAADSAAVYNRWRELVLKYRVSSVQVNDVRLVATMLASEIRNLLTLNGADFALYRKLITVVDPGSFAEEATPPQQEKGNKILTGICKNTKGEVFRTSPLDNLYRREYAFRQGCSQKSRLRV